MKPTYHHPALYTGSEPHILDRIPAEYHGTDQLDYWVQKETDNVNHQIVRSTLGETTGWPRMWPMEVLDNEPTGDQWLAAAKKAQPTIKSGGIILLCGKRGNGKTRMAAEFAIRAGSSRYRTAMRFFLELRATYTRKDISELEIIEDLTKTDLLILDEMQERSETEWENRLLTHLIDARYAEKRPTILISNLSKREMAQSLSPSVIDRIRGNGVTVEFNWESYRKQNAKVTRGEVEARTQQGG